MTYSDPSIHPWASISIINSHSPSVTREWPSEVKTRTPVDSAQRNTKEVVKIVCLRQSVVSSFLVCMTRQANSHMRIQRGHVLVPQDSTRAAGLGILNSIRGCSDAEWVRSR